MLKILNALIFECLKPIFGSKHGVKAIRGCVGKLDLASSGPFSAWPHPAASTIEQTSPASPSLPGEKIARSRADDGVFRQSLEWRINMKEKTNKLDTVALWSLTQGWFSTWRTVRRPLL